MNNINDLISKLNLEISNTEIIETALTHRSFNGTNNERLEFLGDAVIELLVSRYIYNKFPNEKEGMLTSYRSALVKTDTLAKVSMNLGLGEYLKMSKGEEDSGGRDRVNILEDAFEALVGAIYLEKGLEYTDKFLYTNLYYILDEIIRDKLYINNKSQLQEISQSKYKSTPKYRVVKEEGPAHDKVFTVELLINKKPVSTGTGKSKQEAEENAAKEIIKQLYDKD
jgi:ribonuclease-3